MVNEISKDIDKICENCAYWHNNYFFKKHHIGMELDVSNHYCHKLSQIKAQYGFIRHHQQRDPLKINYDTFEGIEIKKLSIKTYRDFGCIHFKDRILCEKEVEEELSKIKKVVSAGEIHEGY